jgi:chromosome segregation protein
MYLARLELHGFKSFAHKTTLTFDDGITCIVGPNGSGKSNIVDAVRWVIGEQRARALRSEKMENVIFNGAKGRRPLGLAEVLLTVENTRGVLPTEFSEVTVGRRLYRSGESEYLLNGAACRLRDVQDLFMDTGMGAGAYSIIELAMVEEILTEEGDDRRRLFEEAAGVTRFKLRRRQALARLDGTQADLTRLRDLIAELDARVRSLRRQAEKAARFRDLDARRRTLEDLLAHAEHARLTDEAAALTEALDRLGADLTARAARVAELEAHGETLALEAGRRETARQDAQAALGAHLSRTRDLDAEARLLRERLARTHADLERTRRDETDADARRAAVASAHRRFGAELDRAAPEAEAASAALTDARAARDAAQATIDAARAQAAAARRAEDEALRARHEAARALDRHAARVEFLRAEVVRLEEEVRGQRSEVREEASGLGPPTSDLEPFAAAVEAASARLSDAEAALDAGEAERQALDTEAAALAEARRALDARRGTLGGETALLERLLDTGDDLDGALRFLARHHAWAHGELLTVADVLETDEAHAAALRAALGVRRTWALAATRAEARAALGALREARAGQATLVAVGALPEGDGPAVEGALPLSRVVRVADARFAPLAGALLAGLYLAPDLDAADRLAAQHPGFRFVTPDGAWAEGAALHGGTPAQADAAPSRLALRHRLDALRTEAAEAEAEHAALTEQQAALAVRRAALDLGALRRARDEAARDVRQAEAARAQAEAQAAARQAQAEARAARHAALVAEAATLDAAEAPLRAALDAAEARADAAAEARGAAEAETARHEGAAHAAFAAYNDAALAAQSATGRLNTLRADHARTGETLAELERQAKTRTATLTTLEGDARTHGAALRTAEAALAAVADDRQGLEDAAQAAEAALLDVRAAVSDHEQALREARRAEAAAAEEQASMRVRLAETEARREALVQGYAEQHGAPLVAGSVEVPEDFAPAAARTELNALRQSLQSLGAVNALALESYEEERIRLDLLLSQERDLEAAETTLRSTIRELDAEASRRFEETFTRIRASFGMLFQELFGPDGAADVVLTRPSDPLESPVEIQARPPGKRPSTLGQLSGGEKTLTAIALLFAIYLVKPSPFCILDEVDAPLDEANVDRFMRLIRRFSAETQFLIVTHNKRTMELADRLYGVTMQEAGVSTLVGVRFEEAAALVE